MSTVRVFGPAYLDRVDRVDRRLLDGGTLDGSFEGRIIPGEGPSRIIDDDGGMLVLVDDPAEGISSDPLIARVRGTLSSRGEPWMRDVRRRSSSESLGGMGAGFAFALRGELTCALGASAGRLDARGERIERELSLHGIAHRALMVASHSSDWTWIVSSGAFGDKLAVGFRGCHAAVTTLEAADPGRACDLLVLAGFSNGLMAEALRVPARIRMLAPAMRNMRERETPLASLSGRFDYLACNRAEWEALENREYVREKTPIVSVTDGPNGATIWFRDPEGNRGELRVPAFPRDRPPLDTNRAGEAFASTLIASLMDRGWIPGPVGPDEIRHAAERASVAAALVLDDVDFGFPSSERIDRAWKSGRVVGTADSGGRVG